MMMIMIGDFFVHLFRKHTQNTRAFALFKKNASILKTLRDAAFKFRVLSISQS